MYILAGYHLFNSIFDWIMFTGYFSLLCVSFLTGLPFSFFSCWLYLFISSQELYILSFFFFIHTYYLPKLVIPFSSLIDNDEITRFKIED